MTTIYALLRPDAEVCLSNICYVGLTKHPLPQRLHQHIADACNPKRNVSYRTRWIKSLVDKNLPPVIFPLEVVDESLAQDRERFWIATLKKFGCPLVNTTMGGELPYFPPEVIERIAAKHRGKPGRKYTEAEKLHLSETVSIAILEKYQDSEYKARHDAGCGHLHTEETKRLLSEQRKGKTNKGHHTRWHATRGLTSSDCDWCIA